MGVALSRALDYGNVGGRGSMNVRLRKASREARAARSCRNCEVEDESTCSIPEEKKPCQPLKGGTLQGDASDAAEPEAVLPHSADQTGKTGSACAAPRRYGRKPDGQEDSHSG